MKKFLSALLAAAMMLTVVIVVAVPASAANENEWAVYTSSDQNDPDFVGFAKDIPGYEYTADGFAVTGAEWKDSTPYAVAQFKEKVNLMDGVYMEVRVDNFTYDAKSKWFMFAIDNKSGDEYNADGLGQDVYAQIGISVDEETGEITTPHIRWNENYGKGDTTYQQRDASTYGFVDSVDAEGRRTYTLEITSDGENYQVIVNGMKASNEFNDALIEIFEKDGGEAYVSFKSQHSTRGGDIEFTVTKFGTSKDTATKPVGSESNGPVASITSFADVEDASVIPEGEPAIIMNGDASKSDVMGMPSYYAGNDIKLNRDGSITCTVSPKTLQTGASFYVNEDVSFNIEDFPAMLVITKGFCNCKETEECEGKERILTYIACGEELQLSEGYRGATKSLYSGCDIVGEDAYLGNYLVWSRDDETSTNMVEADRVPTGRINQMRFDFGSRTYELTSANDITICEVAFFRTEGDASAYYEAYIESLGGEVSDGDDEITTAPAGGEATESQETEPQETEPKETEPKETEPKETEPADTTPAETKPTDKPNTNDGGKDEGGCGSVIGVGAIAIVAVAAAGLVSFRKKDD